MASPDQFDYPDPASDIPPVPNEQTVVLAGGCFWCVEAVYRQLDGVLEAISGYCGGSAATADYRSVCSGRTDHAEAVRVRFDATRVSFGQILKIFFFIAHDPTQLNRQGNDIGRQYRSAIFYDGDEQRRAGEAYIRQINEARLFPRPIVTTLEPLEEFYPAEDYHQDYAARNPDQPYVMCVAAPKVEKARALKSPVQPR
ncbi:MAG: peptide-methionine (S)-S-oxide reductase MsrA [Bryobacteraceae bacterium]